MTVELSRFLPQQGFGPDVNFETIIQYHPILFRVYTPRSLSPLKDDSLFFIGPQFDAKFAPKTPVTANLRASPGALLETATYEDCVRHLHWETRNTSPFVSTSFSFQWSLWEAVRRFNTGVKHDVEIAVIDARQLSGRSVTAIQLLKKKPADKQHTRHWRWCRFAQESQSVLVHGFIPRSAIIASIPLLNIVPHLPSYFLKPNVTSIRPHDLSMLAWDFSDTQRATYRKFCADLHARFLRLPFQTRMRDLSVGSVRLAITLLHPWFYEMVLHETDRTQFEQGVTKARELASILAHWPEPSGSRDHAEMQDVMKSLILLLAEELRAANSLNARIMDSTSAEVERLRGVVNDLEEVIRDQASTIMHSQSLPSSQGTPKSQSHHVVEPSDTYDSDYPSLNVITSFHEQDQHVLPSPSSSISPRDHRKPLKLLIPRSPATSISTASSPSPLTPVNAEPIHSPTPISAISSKLPFLYSDNQDHCNLPQSDSLDITYRSEESLPSSSAPPSPTFPLAIPPLIPRSHSAPPAHIISGPSSAEKSLTVNDNARPPELPEPSSLRLSIPLSPDSGPITSASQYFTATSSKLDGGSPFSPFCIVGVDELAECSEDDTETCDCDSLSSVSSSSRSEAISSAVTGFLIGAFITLCILSSQRRALLTHLT